MSRDATGQKLTRLVGEDEIIRHAQKVNKTETKIKAGFSLTRYQMVSYKFQYQTVSQIQAHMIAEQPTFKALADPTRREILRHLSQSDMSIAEVSDHFDMTRAAVKKHLTVLSDGGLITVRTKGRERVNALNPEGFAPVRDWLSFFDQFWDARLDDLKSAIEKDHSHD